MTASVFSSVSVIDKRRLEAQYTNGKVQSVGSNSSRFSDPLRVSLRGRKHWTNGRRNGALSWRLGRRLDRSSCGSPGNVYFVLSSEQDLYKTMSTDAVDVNFLWSRLVDQLSYLDSKEQRDVFIGLNFAEDAHQGQFRKSGEPFITHPVEVARILAGLGADADTIIAGLLHDTVEDTDRLTFDDIGARFGESVQMIVEGETRLTKVNSSSGSNANSRDLDFRRFFGCITRDVRILLVKLADRLHNMRTMNSMSLAQQQRKGKETLEIYAPLAGLLGLESVQEELEELSLQYLYPTQYCQLKHYLDTMEKAQRKVLEKAKEQLEQEMEDDSILCGEISSFNVTIRQKSFFALFEMFKRAKWDLDSNPKLRQVAQLQIQIETNSSKICYYVLGIVHNIWTPIPGQFEDSLSLTKSGKCTGLKTMVRPSFEEGLVTLVDVVIRATKMLPVNDCIEFRSSDSLPNPAKLNGLTPKRTISNREGSRVEQDDDQESRNVDQNPLWLEALQNWHKEIGESISPRDYVDCVRDDFLKPTVLVFTPRGEGVQLSRGATVLDFAYRLHTQIGNRAMGATVDGFPVGPNYQLKTAQLVAIKLATEIDASIEGLRQLQNRLSCLQTTSAKKKLRTYIKQLFKVLKESMSNVLFFNFKCPVL